MTRVLNDTNGEDLTPNGKGNSSEDNATEDNVMPSIDNPSVSTPDDVFSMGDLESVKQTLGKLNSPASNIGSSKQTEDQETDAAYSDLLKIGRC